MIPIVTLAQDMHLSLNAVSVANGTLLASVFSIEPTDAHLVLNERIYPSSAQSAQYPNLCPSLEHFGDSTLYRPAAQQFILVLIVDLL